MSTFYGSLQGNRGEATRAGSRDSGIRASVQSWHGSVISKLYEEDGQTFARIGVADRSCAFADRTLFDGTIDDLLKCQALKCEAPGMSPEQKALRELAVLVAAGSDYEQDGMMYDAVEDVTDVFEHIARTLAEAGYSPADVERSGVDGYPLGYNFGYPII
jgi:hypothetical protein